MSFEFSVIFTELFARQDVTAMPVESLTFYHSQFTQGNGTGTNGEKYHNYTSQMESPRLINEAGRKMDYAYAPFVVGIPSRNNTLTADLGLVIPLVNITMVNELNRAVQMASEPVSVAYRLYASVTNRAEFVVKLSVTDVEISDSELKATASRADLLNTRFPRYKFTPLQFPGLDR